jgi:hypothetical protein
MSGPTVSPGLPHPFTVLSIRYSFGRKLKCASMALTRRRESFLWGMLLLYAVARISQLFCRSGSHAPNRHIARCSPRSFRSCSGSLLYRPTGVSVFAAFCLGFGIFTESLSLVVLQLPIFR